MKFSLLHVLLIMLLLAMGLQYARLEMQVREMQQVCRLQEKQIQQTQYDWRLFQTSELPLLETRMARDEKWSHLADTTRQAFPVLQERYGQLDAKPDQLAVRQVPSISAKSTVALQWRLRVPQTFPVVLCFGSDNVPYQYPNIPTRTWPDPPALSPAGSGMQTLSPGEHLLSLNIGEGNQVWELILDDNSILSGECDESYTSRSWQGPNSRQRALGFSEDQLPIVLFYSQCSQPNRKPLSVSIWFAKEAPDLPEFSEIQPEKP